MRTCGRVIVVTGMVNLKCVIPCYTLAISERFSYKELIYKALCKFGCLLTLLIAPTHEGIASLS